MPSITLSKKALQATLKKPLPEDELKERITFMGTDLESIKGDDINVEIFPNRPDLLSQQGFNRAFKAFIGQGSAEEHKARKDAGHRVIIEPSVKEVRPYTACAIVKGMDFTDEHIKDVIQIQEKLHVTYGRNRKRCAIGIYPLEHIKPPITYTARKPEDIRFRPLESQKEMDGRQILKEHPAGKEYGHLLEGQELFPIFIDDKGDILSMPPIINSGSTGRITEKTKDVFIECSGFSWHVVHGAIAIIATAMADMGGKVEEMHIEYPKALGGLQESPNFTPERMTLKTSYVKKYLGYDLSAKDIKGLLAKMNIGTEEGTNEKEVIALIPAYRTDILHPIDLVEDIAIAYGTENVEAAMPSVATIGAEEPLEAFSTKIREILSGLGLLEIKNYNLTSEEEQTSKVFVEEDNLVQVTSASSQEYDTLRKRLVCSGLTTLQKNKRHEYPQNLFEIGDVFWRDATWETGVHESKHLCVLLCGEDAEYTKIRQVLDALCEALSLEAKVRAHDSRLFIKGRAGNIRIKDKTIGMIGEVNPEVLENFSLEMPVAALELNLRSLMELLDKEVKI